MYCLVCSTEEAALYVVRAAFFVEVFNLLLSSHLRFFFTKMLTSLSCLSYNSTPPFKSLDTPSTVECASVAKKNEAVYPGLKFCVVFLSVYQVPVEM